MAQSEYVLLECKFAKGRYPKLAGGIRFIGYRAMVLREKLDIIKKSRFWRNEIALIGEGAWTHRSNMVTVVTGAVASTVQQVQIANPTPAEAEGNIPLLD